MVAEPHAVLGDHTRAQRANLHLSRSALLVFACAATLLQPLDDALFAKVLAAQAFDRMLEVATLDDVRYMQLGGR